jgi:CRP/FNR family transcriptional regulator
VIDDTQYRRIMRTLPFLEHAGPELVRAFRANAFLARLPAGQDVFVQGDRTGALALLLSGVVRVYKLGESGREITLYRFGLGESCILTANAILSDQTFPAIATVEEDAEAVMIPAGALREWVGRFDLWRAFLFDLLSQRLVSVLEIVDEVTFQRVDTRLASLLLARAPEENPVVTTHQELADELGSSREVISRLLGGFAEEGLIRTARGSIELLDLAALERRARM